MPKLYATNVYKAKELLSGDSEVYVSLAPSFIANYDVSFTAMKKALMSLGFAGVEETAVGAAIVKDEYDRIVDGEKAGCCHFDLLPYRKSLGTKAFPRCNTLSCQSGIPNAGALYENLKKEHPGG